MGDPKAEATAGKRGRGRERERARESESERERDTREREREKAGECLTWTEDPGGWGEEAGRMVGREGSVR
jgi:hypothetical protein